MYNPKSQSYGSETSFAVTPQNVIKIMILQDYHELCDQWRIYKENPESDEITSRKVNSRLHLMLGFLLGSIMDGKDGEQTYEQLIKFVDSYDPVKMQKVMDYIHIFLYKKGLMKFDSNKHVHPTNIIKQNQQYFGDYVYEPE